MRCHISLPATARPAIGEFVENDSYRGSTCDRGQTHWETECVSLVHGKVCEPHPRGKLALRRDLGPGAAYVFEKPAGGWVNMTETAKLTASDGAAFDYFGISVSLSGDTALVGARYDDDAGPDSFGVTFGLTGAVQLLVGP